MLDITAYLDASPTPFHAVATAAELLTSMGFRELDERDPFPAGPGAHLIRRGGSLVAWILPEAATDGGLRSYRLAGAHTDSPNLRCKPVADHARGAYRVLGVEVYGGALLNSWLDRDLGLAGRVAVRTAEGTELRLLHVDRAVCRIPQLAIHLDRDVNERGLVLNRQQHLAPIWSLDRGDADGVRSFVSEALGVDAGDVVAWDLMLHDVSGARVLGAADEFLASARIDNLVSCWAAARALASIAADPDRPGATVPVVALFDHEEVGSVSTAGADGALLAATLERIAASAGLGAVAHREALAGSWLVSADGAHAAHPNYPERAEPQHPVVCNGGPVLKHNENQRYATDAESAAWVAERAEAAEVPLQHFVVRSDLPCGSTIGPLAASQLGVRTADLGAPMLAMHSVREMTGARDPSMLAALLEACLGR